MFRKILQSWLQCWGYNVTIAEDGSQAWDFLQQAHSPNLLIFDWMMPGIRGRQRAAYQYILVVTAKDDRQDIVRGLEAGADDYLTKPFDKGELRARLRVGMRILYASGGSHPGARRSSLSGYPRRAHRDLEPARSPRPAAPRT